MRRFVKDWLLMSEPVRAVAHRFGWHTNACRGRVRCATEITQDMYTPRMYGLFSGWWRA
jgi:hypothetical protein